MAAAAAGSSELGSDGFLEDEIHQLYENREIMQKLLQDTENLLTEKFAKVLSPDFCHWLQQSLGFESIRERVARLFHGSAVAAADAKKPCIVVVGQTKSGKSSFINELLGGTFVAQSESPCTARVTRLTYSDSMQVRVLAQSGQQIGATLRMQERQSIDESLVKLLDEDRENEELISSTVEVGLPCRFLRHGVDIVDSPGLNENASLDSLTLGAVASFLPLVIYVVDCNSGVTLAVQKDLQAIRRSAASAEIFFLVTKMDVSSQMEAELGRPAEAIEKERAQRVFASLQRLGFLPAGETRATCSRFLCASCWEVRRYRRQTESRHRRQLEPLPKPRWVLRFEEAKLRILQFAQEQFKNLVVGAGSSLRAAHSHILTMFMDKARDIKVANQRKRLALQSIRSLEAEIHRESSKILQRHREQFLQRTVSFFKENGRPIREEVKAMRYSDDVIDERMSAKDIERRCVEEIHALVNDRIVVAFSSFLREGALRNCFDDFQSLREKVAEYEQDVEQTPAYQVLKKTLLDGYSLSTSSFMRQGFVMFFSNIGKLLHTLLKHPAVVLSRPVQDPEWKDYQAKCYLKNIDKDKLVDCLVTSIGDWFDCRHAEFEASMRHSELLVDRAFRLTNKERERIMRMAPEVARLHMNALAVMTRYELRHHRVDLSCCLGSGAQAHVYRVLAPEDGGKELAAKRLWTDRAGLADIAAEVYHSSVLEHPNLLQVVGVRVRENILERQRWSIDLYMPLMHSDAAAVMEQQPQLQLAKRLWLALQLITALEFLHSCDLIHRDVKLANLLVNQPITEAKLSDFGLLKCRGFVDRTLVGTPVYLAPELVAHKQYDASVDIFSFGVALWYLASGSGSRHPRYVSQLQTVDEVLNATADGCRPERLPSFPDRLWQLMCSCWLEEPKERPTAVEAKNQLLSIVTGLG